MARVARITGGFALVLAGIAMLALPGPGIVTILAGLALLSKDLHWAGRLADWAKAKTGKTDAAERKSRPETGPT